MLKNNKGITLVALVITIVVMLILAGITINYVIGSRSIITKSKEAKTAYEVAENTENEHLDVLANEINNELL